MRPAILLVLLGACFSAPSDPAPPSPYPSAPPPEQQAIVERRERCAKLPSRRAYTACMRARPDAGAP